MNNGKNTESAIPKVESNEQKFSVDEYWFPNRRLFDSMNDTTVKRR
jgi:hypothetical protein